MCSKRDKLSFTRNDADMLEFSRAAKLGFAKPEVWNVEIPFENAANAHATLMQNFVNAILDGEPLIAPGEEGIHSVELANVILYSSLLGQTVELPMDSAAYETQAQPVDCRVEDREEGRGGLQRGFHRVIQEDSYEIHGHRRRSRQQH